jgi:hypothetical protein
MRSAIRKLHLIHGTTHRELCELERRLSHDMYDERRLDDWWFAERREDYARLFYLAAACGCSTFIGLPPGHEDEVGLEVEAEARARAEEEMRAARARAEGEMRAARAMKRVREQEEAAEAEERARAALRKRKKAREALEDVVDERVHGKCVCPVCSKVLKSAEGVVSHLQAKKDLEHTRYRAGCESAHGGGTHGGGKRRRRESQSGAHGGGAYGGGAYGGGGGGGYDSDGDGGGYGGFSSADVNDLLCQGVKPWDNDAGRVLAALDGYY